MQVNLNIETSHPFVPKSGTMDGLNDRAQDSKDLIESIKNNIQKYNSLRKDYGSKLNKANELKNISDYQDKESPEIGFGHFLAKFGNSSKNPLVWIEALFQAIWICGNASVRDHDKVCEDKEAAWNLVSQKQNEIPNVVRQIKFDAMQLGMKSKMSLCNDFQNKTNSIVSNPNLEKLIKKIQNAVVGHEEVSKKIGKLREEILQLKKNRNNYNETDNVHMTQLYPSDREKALKNTEKMIITKTKEQKKLEKNEIDYSKEFRKSVLTLYFSAGSELKLPSSVSSNG